MAAWRLRRRTGYISRKGKAAAVGGPRRPCRPEIIQERSELRRSQRARVGHVPPVGLRWFADPDTVGGTGLGAAEHTDQVGTIGRPIKEQGLARVRKYAA